MKIGSPAWKIEPCERVLFVGSCFADNIGRRFKEEGFPVVVNPYGTMYNPASVLHTVERYLSEIAPEPQESPATCFITLGTNHVYILKETGEIVDNCMKRPQSLFQECELSVDECANCLNSAVETLRKSNPGVRVVFTVSPIRYRKYGYHESRLAKATLLLAARDVIANSPSDIFYFPAYEILNDELRDYRFYSPDMIHPSEQAVEYIWERLVENCFSPDAKRYLAEWRPLKEALGHRPFNSGSEEYRLFMQKTHEKLAAFSEKYPKFALMGELRNRFPMT